MSELHSSRRAVMRALALTPIIIAPAVKAAQTDAINAPAISMTKADNPYPQPTQHPEWLALLAEERAASDAFTVTAAEHDDAYYRFFAERDALTERWEKDRAGSCEPGLFIAARPASEVGDARTLAGIRDYNANSDRLRAEKGKIEERARAASGFNDADQRYTAASSRHRSAISALVAYPSRDPDIIVAKMQLLIKEYGDDSGDLGPLLASIIGEVEA